MFLTPKSLLAPALLAIVLAAPPAVVAQDDPAIERARAILKLFTDGRHDDFLAAGDEKVKAGLKPEQVAQIWAGLTFQLGGYVAVDATTVQTVGEHRAVRLVCRFERGTCTLRIVLDQQDRMAGFWCDAIDATPDYQPPAYVDKNAFREEKVTVSAGQFELPGTLTIPAQAGPHPAVVLVHGSGPHDEDETVGANKPFKDLAWGLGSRGVAVLRYVKRTKAHPTAKPPAEWTLEDETIDDARAATKLLRLRPDIDPKRVFVLGHSLGAMAAPFIATRDGQLAGLIIMAGSPRSLLDIIPEQVEYLARLDGDVSEEEQKQLRQITQGIADIRAGKLQSAQAVLGMPAAYLARLEKLDPAAEAARLRVPILILQAGRDYQITMKDFELWKQRLGERANVTYKLFAKLNHLFIAGDGPSGPAEYQQAGHVDEAVIKSIAEWIASPPREQPEK